MKSCGITSQCFEFRAAEGVGPYDLQCKIIPNFKNNAYLHTDKSLPPLLWSPPQSTVAPLRSCRSA